MSCFTQLSFMTKIIPKSRKNLEMSNFYLKNDLNNYLIIKTDAN